jgi:signal transduction histidine kinase
MTAIWRCAALALVLAAMWASPYALPIQEGRDGAGWYLVFALSSGLTVLLLWSLLQDLPKVASRRGGPGRLPWLVTGLVGIALILLDWKRWPSTAAFLNDWGPPLLQSAVASVHHAELVQLGVGLALPALVVLASDIIGRSDNVLRAPLRYWVTGVALFLAVTPPALSYAKFGQFVAFVVGCWAVWTRALTALEQRYPARRWRIRLVALLLCVPPLLVQDDRLVALGIRHMELFRLQVCLTFAAMGLLVVVLSLSGGDLLAWVTRRSTSTRVRMLAVGLACAGVTFLIADLDVRMSSASDSGKVLSHAMSVQLKLALVGVVAWAFSAAMSKRLAQSLEQSVRAISEVGRGNLDVVLDASGRDDVAEVARSFNQMVALLKEAEFLEKINADLRSRSAALTQALKALQSAQADLVRSERMASVATLVKGIAHELNNPINYIAGNMAPLRRYCDFITGVAGKLADGRPRGPDELRALLQLTDKKDLPFVSEDLGRLTGDIAEGARRAQLIVMDLQSLTSAAQRGIERVDLHRVVQQTVSLFGARLRPGVRLEPVLSPVPAVTAYAGQIEQVFVNLTDNALRAIGGSGKVRIQVGAEENWALVKVTDDGPGMTAEVKAQAFEPFFTTRAAGDGSGLGLAIVASIVRTHGGTVTLKSDPGAGTEVEVRLPLTNELTPGVSPSATG